MDKSVNRRLALPALARFAMLGLCGLGAMSAALAAPPTGQRSEAHWDLHASRLDLHPLDLHPSFDLHTSETAMSGVAAEKAPAAFPSSLHRQPLGTQEELQLPDLGSSAGGLVRPMSRSQELVQRVHREGLPIARLWQNKSALLSLGLNQKGKPGHWLTQKIH
jgi:hypothetical protein